MNTKEHYDNHLGNFYDWMIGDFDKKQAIEQRFFESNNVRPFFNKIAIDLGAGHGLQSISLAKLGFSVKAVDFNRQLLQQLRKRIGELEIELILSDVESFNLGSAGFRVIHKEEINRMIYLIAEKNEREN
jgi:ubiquinone/menaquinone biosynthesis C-methylase UbiE